MKNKLKKTMSALCAALILMGGFSVPAYAQGAATEPPAGDATNDSNVVVEEKEETPPLTPKGNATLVDDYGGNKQKRKRRPLPQRETLHWLTITAAISSLSLLPPKEATISISSLTAPPRANRPYIS